MGNGTDSGAVLGGVGLSSLRVGLVFSSWWKDESFWVRELTRQRSKRPDRCSMPSSNAGLGGWKKESFQLLR